MATELQRFKSRKSNTTYVVSVEEKKPYLTAEGEMCCNREVLKRINEIRLGKYDTSTALWIARQLSNSI